MTQIDRARTPHTASSAARPHANENDLPIRPAPNAALVEPGALARKLMAMVARAEQGNFRNSVFGNLSMHDTRNFPFALELEQNWTIIRGELARVMMNRDAMAGFREGDVDAGAIGRERGWKTFPFVSYGRRSDGNIAECPETWRLLQRVPGLISAMFSILEPGQRLPPHRGPYNGLLRLHLGLIIPEPQERLGIRVADEIHRWDEGRALIFDDAFEHEAWNETPHTRVVLFVDFAKPLRFPARLVNGFVLNSFLFRPFIREGIAGAGRLSRRLYRQAQILRDQAAQRIVQEAAGQKAAFDREAERRVPAEAASADSTVTARASSSDRPTASGQLVATASGEWPFDNR